MSNENFYDAFVSCLEHYPFYLRKNSDFITNNASLKKILLNFPLWLQKNCLENLFILKLIGEEASGKMTLAFHLYKRFFCSKSVDFLRVSDLFKPMSLRAKQKIFLYCYSEKTLSEEDYFVIQKLFKEKRLACLVLASKEEFRFAEESCVKLALPSFLERSSDRYLVLSSFLSRLSPSVPLSSEAFLFYAKGSRFRSVFEVKYSLLWSHYKAVSKGETHISLDNFSTSLAFVSRNKEKFLMLEKLDFSSLAGLVKEVGYKELIAFLGDILMEKIFLNSNKSYTKSSLYTQLPISTIRSRRLKYLRKGAV